MYGINVLMSTRDNLYSQIAASTGPDISHALYPILSTTAPLTIDVIIMPMTMA